MQNTFTLKEVFSFGWDAFKKNMQFLLLSSIIMFILSTITNLKPEGGALRSSILSVISLIALVISIVVAMGMIKSTIKIVDGKEQPKIDDLFTERKLFWRFIFTNILYGAIVLVGLILLIVPGIIWAIKYQFARYLVIDKQYGIKESFKRSAEMTEGNKWQLLNLMLLAVLICLLGAMLFGIGLLVAVPVVLTAYAYVYRKLESAAKSAPAATA